MSTLESQTTDDYVGYVDGKTNGFRNFKTYARPLTFQAQVIYPQLIALLICMIFLRNTTKSL